jgi:predicted RNA-binding Zn ribbon-like protein
VDFLNTRDERSYGSHQGRGESDRDRLRDPAALKRWLLKHHLIGMRANISEGELAKARQFRDVFRTALAAKPDSLTTHSVDAFLATIPVQVRLAGRSPLLVPASQGVDAALAELLIAAVIADAKREWARVKMCAANDCRWVFYDGSKNRLGRWCSMEVCGNRVKTRTYRTRQYHQRS